MRLTVNAGAVAAQPPVWRREGESSLLIGWSSYAEYRLEAGDPPNAAITVGEVSEDEALLAFAASVLPLALPIVGLEPLHGSAVAVDGGALLLLGPSGAGKSTLSSALVGQGLAFVTDDACAIDCDGLLWPGPPMAGIRDVYLFDELAGRPLARYHRKTLITPDLLQGGPLPVAASILLEPTLETDLELTPLGDAGERFRALAAQVRAPYLFTERRRPLQLAVLASCSRLPVARLRYRMGAVPVERIAATVRDWALDLYATVP